MAQESPTHQPDQVEKGDGDGERLGGAGVHCGAQEEPGRARRMEPQGGGAVGRAGAKGRAGGLGRGPRRRAAPEGVLLSRAWRRDAEVAGSVWGRSRSRSAQTLGARLLYRPAAAPRVAVTSALSARSRILKHLRNVGWCQAPPLAPLHLGGVAGARTHQENSPFFHFK